MNPSTSHSTNGAFDLAAALPQGRISIGASAGTGKTYALSTLAARYVAEADIPVRRLLIVTFTRAAAAELKDRVRARLVEFETALASGDHHDDEVLVEVCNREAELRLPRVRTAITEFDSATITTIHGFAQQVMGTLGSVALADPEAVLVDDSRAIVAQVATDLLVTEALEGNHLPQFVPSVEDLCRAAAMALGNPDSILQPPPSGRPEEETPVADSTSGPQADLDRAAAIKRDLVDAVVHGVSTRRIAAGTLSFDDLLVRLRNALADPHSGEAVRQMLRQRYSVALIDEFQDTDPVQWAIFDGLFGREEESDEAMGTLMLVGDPKQAIYTFRGANVHTYLQAVRGTSRRSLETNWRSDPAVLRANQALLSDVSFGDDRIAFENVKVSDRHAERRFTDTDGRELQALSIRLATGDGVPRSKARGKEHFTTGDGAKNVYRDLARHVRDLLATARIPAPKLSQPEATDDDDASVTIPLAPEHVAVLISANREGPEVRDALADLGIPAVIARGDSVVESTAATHWHRVLYAMARPGDPTRARGAATTWFFGWDAMRVATATDADLAWIQQILQDWANHLRERGVAAFIGRAVAETSVGNISVTARVLALTDGERNMTDLDHVGELLSSSAGQASSASALLAAFEQLGHSNTADPETDIAARRVESESSAVQIMTTFVAKGLEFPVVCCPSLWRPNAAKANDNIWWDHDVAMRNIDIASDTPWGSPEEYEDRLTRATREAVGTNLRVLYVALTRARHHTALWWLPTEDAWLTGLARVLFARGDDGLIDPEQFSAERVGHLDDEASLVHLEPVVERSQGSIGVAVVGDLVDDADAAPWTGLPAEPLTELEVSGLERVLDRDTSRWSFTAITSRIADSHGPASGHQVVSHPAFDPDSENHGESGQSDEGNERPDNGSSETNNANSEPVGNDPDAQPLPLGGIAGGAGFGTLVHEVLERLDFCSGDLETDLARLVDERLRWNPWPVERDLLIAGLARVVRTPLGPLFSGAALAQVPQTDRLDELDFDLTLGESGVRASDSAIGELVLRHLEHDSPHTQWAQNLATGPFDTVLAGHLTGSIDLVARVRDGDGAARFVVCDYKTNRLAPSRSEPMAAHFHPDRLPAVMAGNHYQLQALLYCVALHRYLRWRLPDYDPTVHLGGVGYLFVRGMVGPSTPTHNGVPNGLADWRPAPSLITELSDLLDGSTGVSS